MGTAVAVIAIVLTVALLVWFVAARKHPEAAAGHDPLPAADDESKQFFGDRHDRPAGPGAEADGVAGRGQPAPGPSAESLGD